MRIETYTVGINFDGNIANSLDKIDDQVTELGRNMRRTFADAGRRIQGSLERVRLPALAVSSAGVVAFRKLVSGASDLEESVNAVNVVFGESSSEILSFSKDAATAAGLSQKAFNQLSISTGALLKDTGLSSDELSETTINLTKRAADLASVFNTDVDDALSAINQALRGETEAIRRYAGDVTDATLQTFLASEGIDRTVKSLTQQEKRLFRVKLIMKQTADVQDDFKNTIDSVANTSRVQNAVLENTADTLGKRLLPVMKSIQRVTGRVINAFAKLSPTTQDLIVKIGLAVTVIAGLLFVASFVAPTFLLIGSAFGALATFAGKLVVAIKFLAPILLAVGRALVAVFVANPIGAAVAVLTFVIWDLWKAFNGGDSVLANVWDWFANKFPSAAEIIKDAFMSIRLFITDTLFFIANAYDSITGGFNDAISSVKGFSAKFIGIDAPQLATPSDQLISSFFAPKKAPDSGSTSTTNIQIDNINSNAENGQSLIDDLVANDIEATPLPAGVP